MSNTVSSQWGDTAAITLLCFNEGPLLLWVAVISRDKVFNIVVVGFPTVELGLFLEVLVFLDVLMGIGLLSSAIRFFLRLESLFALRLIHGWLNLVEVILVGTLSVMA